MTKKNTLLTLGVAVVIVGGFILFDNDADEQEPYEADDLLISEDIFDSDQPTDTASVPAPKPKAPAAKVTSPAPTPIPTPVRLFENGQYITIVSLTYTGFDPQNVTISAGESVRFVNRSGNAMRILSTTEYTGLSQEKSVGKGGVYELSFPKVGTWTFNNGTRSGYVGVVNVK